MVQRVVEFPLLHLLMLPLLRLILVYLRLWYPLGYSSIDLLKFYNLLSEFLTNGKTRHVSFFLLFSSIYFHIIISHQFSISSILPFSLTFSVCSKTLFVVHFLNSTCSPPSPSCSFSSQFLWLSIANLFQLLIQIIIPWWHFTDGSFISSLYVLQNKLVLSKYCSVSLLSSIFQMW